MNKDMNDLTPMQAALEEARAAQSREEIPVGAVVVDASGVIISRAGNETRGGKDPTAHAEILAIRRAAEKLGQDRLRDCTLYVTLEPCPMCAGAIAHARLKRLVYGAYDSKGGAVDHGVRLFDQPTCLHKIDVVGGVDEAACAQLLTAFFNARRCSSCEQ